MARRERLHAGGFVDAALHLGDEGQHIGGGGVADVPASTYWVATCPFAIMESSSAGGATKRPSPWLMATVCVSPTSMRLIQGDIVLATRVRPPRCSTP